MNKEISHNSLNEPEYIQLKDKRVLRHCHIKDARGTKIDSDYHNPPTERQVQRCLTYYRTLLKEHEQDSLTADIAAEITDDEQLLKEIKNSKGEKGKANSSADDRQPSIKRCNII